MLILSLINFPIGKVIINLTITENISYVLSWKQELTVRVLDSDSAYPKAPNMMPHIRETKVTQILFPSVINDNFSNMKLSMM